MKSSKNVWSNKNLVKVLKDGGVVIMPTDTLYGIVGKAKNPKVVERIYNIRKRSPDKPCIILIGNFSELKKFGIVLTEMQKNKIGKYLPAEVSAKTGREPTSFILDCPDESLRYLHRGTKTLAFRIPFPKALRDLLLKVGSLIAPSANLEARPPSKTISEAKKYFREAVDLYLNGGQLNGKASKVIQLHKDGSVSILRE